MPNPLPHQIEGALFLARRQAALLADEPRVGKTGAAIRAADYAGVGTMLVVTKATARAQWGADIKAWGLPRKVQVIYSGGTVVNPLADAVVVGWGMVFAPTVLRQLVARRWDALILDESHEAKAPASKRTQAVYGHLAPRADRVWCLSGTPSANSNADLWTMLAGLEPERLRADAERGWTDVAAYDDFMARYCVTRRKVVGGQWITYPIAGRNEDELRDRLAGFWLRRQQSDVGIRAPLYSTWVLHADKVSAIATAVLDDPRSRAVLEALEVGAPLAPEDELHLGTLRRVTGELKAPAVVEAVAEELDGGLDRIVLMAWHKNVLRALREGLARYGVASIDGGTPPHDRAPQVARFQRGDARVFVGQILAAGEAIDLSAAHVLAFVEPTFVPKEMKQAALRICNHAQTRQPLVRVCALEGSIDEALGAVLLRKGSSIRKVWEHN